MVRPPCCDKEDDVRILAYISKNKTGNWTSSPRKSGLKRCGKSCRLRWSNYRRPDSKHESFNQQEEELIIKLHAAIGSRWNVISQQLRGRTENEIKNHWNTKLKKKLTEMGIDPVTHKPFSQILADYGTIGGLSRAVGVTKHMGSTKRDFKKLTNTSLIPPKSSPYTFTPNSQVSLNVPFTLDPYANHTNTSSHSLDLLSQLQAISLVTEGSNCNNFHNNSNNNYDYDYNHDLLSQTNTNSSLTSSTSACSSNNNVGQVVMSDESFSWHDFLLDKELEMCQNNQTQWQERDNSTELLSIHNVGSGFSSSSSRTTTTTSSSDASLFLEAMLDQENDMFLNFPGLMEEPLYY